MAWTTFDVVAASVVPVPKEPVFERDIRPLLKTHCFQCHGEGEKLKGGVDLRLRRLMLKESDSGRVLVPGKPSDSVLLKMVRSGEMPKDGKKLTAQEVNLLEKWVAKGAKTLREEPAELLHGFYLTEEDRTFWSFQPIRSPSIPAVKKTANRVRIRNPIDQFLLARLEKEKLAYAPEADRRTLIRRVSLDLTGLPPSPDEIRTFEADSRPDAYERLVDRLLESPRYGERWARHWLDVAGYADSNGFAESDSIRPFAWRYRDYVIRSMNADKPFDRFIVEQLAGDELFGLTQANAAGIVLTNAAALEALTATGFLRMSPDGTGDSVPDANLARNQVMADTLKVVSSSLLGLTVACAQCHDHRYDPISHVDYHRLRAVFEPAYDWKNWRRPSDRLVSLYTADDRTKAEAIEVEARKLDEEKDKKYKEALEKVFEKELAKLPEGIRETVKVARNTPKAKRTAEQSELFKRYPSADVQGALDLYDPEANKKIQEEKAKADKLRATKPTEPFVMALTEVPDKVPDTFLFYRGDQDQPKEKVAPGELAVLAARGSIDVPVKDGALPSTGRRLAYARWLTSGNHPLVARVLVNRIWLNHFGRGLVNTPGDFGRLGERPTHPELLDWLADEFTTSGWSLKHLHKLMVTSAAYRQSSRNDPSQRSDPDNRLYARWKLQRLDGETLRDSLLAVAGSLNLKGSGEPVPVAIDKTGRVVAGNQKKDGNGDPTDVEPVGDQELRRSIYLQVRRRTPLTVLETFDGPIMSPNCEARSATTVAPQSLLLLNDGFVVDQSRRMAARLRKERPEGASEQLALAWELLYSAVPTPRELALCAEVYQKQLSDFQQRLQAAIESKKAAAGQEKGKEKPKSAAIDPEVDALASVYQVLASASRFLYVE